MAGYYPIFLNIEGMPCLVIGGGEVAERKIASLLQNGACVTVISPAVTPAIKNLIEAGKILWLSRAFAQGDTAGNYLVISATNQEEVNQRVFEECRAARILVNVVDDPAKCGFLVPAVVRRGDLAIAVSTGGASPLVARQIRQELGERYGPEYATYLKLLAGARKGVLTRFSDPKQRREIFEQLTNGYLLRLVQGGRVDEAKEWVKQCLS